MFMPPEQLSAWHEELPLKVLINNIQFPFMHSSETRVHWLLIGYISYNLEVEMSVAALILSWPTQSWSEWPLTNFICNFSTGVLMMLE